MRAAPVKYLARSNAHGEIFGRARNTLIVEAGAAAAADALSQLFREATYSMKQLRFPLLRASSCSICSPSRSFPRTMPTPSAAALPAAWKTSCPSLFLFMVATRSAWVRDSRPAAAALSRVMRLLRPASAAFEALVIAESFHGRAGRLPPVRPTDGWNGQAERLLAFCNNCRRRFSSARSARQSGATRGSARRSGACRCSRPCSSACSSAAGAARTGRLPGPGPGGRRPARAAVFPRPLSRRSKATPCRFCMCAPLSCSCPAPRSSCASADSARGWARSRACCSARLRLPWASARCRARRALVRHGLRGRRVRRAFGPLPDAAVHGGRGLRSKKYFLGKTLQGVISLPLGYGVYRIFYGDAAAFTGTAVRIEPAPVSHILLVLAAACAGIVFLRRILFSRKMNECGEAAHNILK